MQCAGWFSYGVLIYTDDVSAISHIRANTLLIMDQTKYNAVMDEAEWDEEVGLPFFRLWNNPSFEGNAVLRPEDGEGVNKGQIVWNYYDLDTKNKLVQRKQPSQ